MFSIKKRVAKKLASYNEIVVWGAGGLGRLALKQWLPIDKVSQVVDRNEKLWGTAPNGIVIAAPEAIQKKHPECIVVCSVAYLEIKEQIRALGFTGDVFYVYELFLPEDDAAPLSPLQSLYVDIIATKNSNLLMLLLNKPQILVNITYRIANACRAHNLLLPVYAFLYVVHAFICVLFSVQLPLNTPIGPGFVIAHYGTIVFTARASIGSFFTVYHGCTVGTNDSGEGPSIGNFVTLYAGSHLLGKSAIGSYTRIGANSVVLDFKGNGYETLAGAPARIKRTFEQ